ncbi:unnamed protein product [Bemisia tabaci]|uniref:Receptor protein-tyrosine kinase n=1 Tax=Bemisia tabaci TaxID=7038 RepID=A0A9P0CCS3_BEMTA|nr:PREDICTED: epidermal growth factor receptor isoform X2 [Bemisia tabaci]CAH0768676.1 unnamed protein product [Bemisia tabaci]
MKCMSLDFLVFLIIAVGLGLGDRTKEEDHFQEKVCIGTNGRMSVPSTRSHHYKNLQDRYTNCTYVDGNLEITWLEDQNLDLSFLANIREVTGYVLISHVSVKKVALPKLQIIRGRTTFKAPVHEDEWSLLITLTKVLNVEMPALRDVLNGSVGILNNYNLCHIKSINWDEIITGPNARYTYIYNFTNPERECPPCDKSCPAGCWGEGPQNCQKFSKTNCSPQCYQGRCFGPNPRDCCHLFCAGGCTGPKQNDCLACRNFYDDGECVQECPAMQKYNSITYSWETNPHGKYAYGATCVKQCPEHLLRDNGACVRICPPMKRAVNGECVPCEGPCPKTCEGVPVVHAGNIDSFQDCTIIEGSISILEQSFKGFQQVYSNFSFGDRYPEMHPDKLEVFSTLKEVTGFINIQGSNPNFTNLSYFRNLEVIGGRMLTELFSSLYVVKTSLRSLGLRSLKKINTGRVTILENAELCFGEGIDWYKFKQKEEHPPMMENNKAKEKCVQDGLVCDAQCSKDGCWGPGPDQCLACANYRLENNTCIQDCSVLSNLFEYDSKLCKECHPECESTCHGPGAGNCTRCKNVKDGPFCVPACPSSKYSRDGECLPCHPNCMDSCTGPENNIGPNGCRSCEKAITNADVVVERCLQKNESCPDGYYYEWVVGQEQGPLKPLAGKAICRKCHPRCKKCIGYGFHVEVCQECVNYKRGEVCEDECPPDHYADDKTHVCNECYKECTGCYGPGPSNCFNCRSLKIFKDGRHPDSNATAFNCTSHCPSDIPHKIFPEDNVSGPYCSIEPNVLKQKENPPITGSTAIFTIVLLGSCCIIAAFIYGVMNCRKNAKNVEEAVKMTMVMSGIEDNEPLRPSNVKPNLAKLRIIKEAEMRKGGILGYGAFGTVYKGVWVPAGESMKIPVAIKVLRDTPGVNTSSDFLEEAYIMASVEHPNLLQLLAVCMTSQLMLVTQLMPLGCLLDYVRNNRDKIGSKPLLNWCTQIARGMAYLEEKRLVHRDLAARNVLVQTPNCVKITDFGLAKLLDINEDEYKAAGGKMPIKWLALECIQHRIFTHKSDVWAFGVTVWELLTYGGRPYENVPARDVPELLEKGDRLSQPRIATIEVYLVMIKCWMLDAESRPSFKDLADDFAKMARDPGRYLVIQGDKHLRLPSYSSQDEKDVIHPTQTEVVDGATDSEEYLQPKGTRVVPVRDNPTPQNVANWGELRKYSSEHQPSRYCTDPLGKGESDTSDDLMSVKREAQVGDLKLELPLDEDDYLMPSPQTSQPTQYMDLIGDSKLPNDTIKPGMTRNYNPDFLPGPQTSVDNPEYHFVANQISQTIGIPHPVMGANGPCLGIQQKSSEEESDHEYYNDFDRLQRELQPLRRNETTV